jgi:cellulose synthase/poly-beta-1,6-N-acetylglucosamine synthase-like glycosyltransferase
MTWTWNQVSPFVGTRSIDVLAGGAAAYRREVFEKCRFSEFFGGYSAGEDLEMSRRVAHDWSLVVCGDALVNHHHVPESRPAGFAFGRMAIRNRFFVWRRHSPDVGVGVWFKFWLDQVLIGGGDLMRFFRKPWQGTYLLRFLGTVCGGLECWVLPPRYEEPPARREYEFELVDLRSVEKN